MHINTHTHTHIPIASSYDLEGLEFEHR